MRQVKKYWFPTVSFLLTLLSALFWVALRINHSGISKFLGADTNQSFLIMNLPVLVCVAAWMGCGVALWGLTCWDKRKWPAFAGFITGVIMTVGAIVVIKFGAKDYLRFISVHFWKSVAVSACIIAFALVLFFPVAGKKKLKGALSALVVLAAVVIGYQLRPCQLTYGAVVYAVEDDYQIVFSTSDSAIAWVEIGGERYYDLYAGSMKSIDRVHKVSVPQEVLDAAGSYTVCAKQMIYRGPFGGYTGETLSQSYDFRPVDTSDGLDYFTLSDVHEAVDAATKAAKAAGDMDFIVLAGDLISMVETYEDAQLANELAYKITEGQIPVIYARGNHEIKGEYAEDFYKYVGAKGTDFYYTVTLGGDVFAMVLDMGEDHEDDWWEYYGTAQFDLYRQEQTGMLEEVLADGDYENYRYRLAICHIPVVLVDDDGLFERFRLEWTELLNQIGVDMCVSGHQHLLWPLLPGDAPTGALLTYTSGGKEKTAGYLTEHDFPNILAGRRSLTQEGGTQKDGYDQYTGLHIHVNMDNGRQLWQYINSQGNILTGKYPFSGEAFSNILFPKKEVASE